MQAFYSTPQIYTEAKHASGPELSVKKDDFFPYADCPVRALRGGGFLVLYCLFFSSPLCRRFVDPAGGEVGTLFGRKEVGEKHARAAGGAAAGITLRVAGGGER